MKKFFTYTLIAILTFIGIVIAFAPAALLWRQVESELVRNMPDLTVANVRGTLWDGDAELFYRQFPVSLLEWQLAAMPVITARQADIQLQLRGEGHNFTANVQAGAESLSIDSLVGHVDAMYINRVSQPQGLTFASRVTVESLDLTSDLRWIQTATGRITWPGGKIISRTWLDGTRVFDLPALVGDIEMQGRDILLTLHPNSRNQSLVNIVLKPDGWLVVRVKARLFDLAGLAWPGGSSLDDTVLQFEEQVLRGAR
jgi:hypothetical protein